MYGRSKLMICESDSDHLVPCDNLNCFERFLGSWRRLTRGQAECIYLIYQNLYFRRNCFWSLSWLKPLTELKLQTAGYKGVEGKLFAKWTGQGRSRDKIISRGAGITLPTGFSCLPLLFSHPGNTCHPPSLDWLTPTFPMTLSNTWGLRNSMSSAYSDVRPV